MQSKLCLAVMLLATGPFLPANAQWQTNGSNIYYGNGNVGIGTSTPTEMLTVAGPARLGGKLYWTWPNRCIEEVVQPDGSSILMRFRNSQFSADGNPNGGFDFAGQDGTSFLHIVGGNVGINTVDTKGYRFAVNGDAIFTRVLVKTLSSWPDYVFNADYPMTPLDSVARYIQINHHLPDVPSADSMAKKGLDLGANQEVLLKKIEELTLYLIQQNKELELLKEQNKELEEKIRRVTRVR